MGRINGRRSRRDSLHRRLKSCELSCTTIDEIVNHLRSIYPDYQRLKVQTLTQSVRDALQSSRKHTDTHTPKHDEDEDRIASPKKRKKIDESEERLQTMEPFHLRMRMRNNKIQGPLSTSSAASALESEDDDDKDEAMSEPAFDLMKIMLRNSYAGKKAANSSKAESSKKLLSKDDVEMEGKKGPCFRDFGGMKEVLKKLEVVINPMLHPRMLRHLGLRPINGILLHGPPGCGKTRLAHAIANEIGLPFYDISATEVVSGVPGASEENIRELFSKAHRTAPSIIFIDEIDAISPARKDLQRGMENRIVSQLITCMNQPSSLMQPANDLESSDDRPRFVLVIAATNRLDAIDRALRRPGRFDREILIAIPDESAREEILSVFIRNVKLEGSFNLRKIARSTPGFVGADLEALVNEAGYLAMKRVLDERKPDSSQDFLPEEMDKLNIKMSDFEEAIKMVQPSLRREGFSSLPDVKWEDVGGLDFLRQEFERLLVTPIRNRERYERMGMMDHETGFLLYGPPGCGKTLIAKAVANEAGANFIHIKGPELLNKYVGESELAVRTLFYRARTCAPCIIFFDEVDSLTCKRGKDGGLVSDRLLDQLLIELHGGEQRLDVFVIGATNKFEVMDEAVLRPGRFDNRLYVPLPSPDERVLILKALARKKSIDASVDLSAVARMEACDNFSGADLAALMKEATRAACEDKSTSTIKTSHFEVALSKVYPSISKKEREHYERLSKRFKGRK